MKGGLGVIGLIGVVVALLIVGLLVRRQVAPAVLPATAASGAAAPARPGPTARGQAQQLQQDVRKSVEGAMQQPRPMPEDPP